MTGSSFGTLFKVHTFGESHGGGVGCVVDGCPANIDICEADIQMHLDRRRPGQSEITTPRKEQDTIRILSGVFEGKTTGTPILMIAHNADVRSDDYHSLKDLYRPSHADFTYEKKYGVRDWRGSGRASARETLGRVAAGAIAQKFLAENAGITFVSFVEQVGLLKASVNLATVTLADVDATAVRCPDGSVAPQMHALIEKVQLDGDSIGGVIRGVIRGAPPGLGEPVFDKLHADLGKAMLSINAAKGFDIGLGFDSLGLTGSQHNDPFQPSPTGARPATNRAGGVLGGISTGEDIYFRVAFKPVATIRREQQTVCKDGSPTTLAATGRHDPCVLPRAIPIVDAMAALVIMDHYLMFRARAA
jgi:chorismate synthase